MKGDLERQSAETNWNNYSSSCSVNGSKNYLKADGSTGAGSSIDMLSESITIKREDQTSNVPSEMISENENNDCEGDSSFNAGCSVEGITKESGMGQANVYLHEK